MKIDDLIKHTLVLGLLGGCAAAIDDDSQAMRSARPASASTSEVGSSQGSGATGTSELDPEARIEMNVSARFTTDASHCEPLGFPVTAFLTASFGQDALVEDVAEAGADNTCLHAQVLSAPSSAFGDLAYGVLCQGGDDVELCNAITTRRCSLDLLMTWAAERSEPVAARDAIFGFTFELAPQPGPARMALYRQAQDEVDALRDESEAVMSAIDMGTRNCPDENRALIDNAHAQSMDMAKQLEGILN